MTSFIHSTQGAPKKCNIIDFLTTYSIFIHIFSELRFTYAVFFTVITLLDDVVYTIYLQSEKDESKSVYIKNFVGSGVLNKNFGFCSNKDVLF